MIIVGGIPIAMPTVLSVTLALGAYQLAKQGAIVARMSAVEEMAGAVAAEVAVLCFSQIVYIRNKIIVTLKQTNEIRRYCQSYLEYAKHN